jgi:hypothetical protein
VFHLGYSGEWGWPDLSRGCAYLRDPKSATVGLELVAYHADFFDEFLSAIPEDGEEALRWLEEHLSLERFLRSTRGRFVAEQNILAEPGVSEEDGLA